MRRTLGEVRLREWVRQRSGVRVRSALAAGGVVALASVLSMAALLLLMRHSLEGSVREQARQQAGQLSNRLAADQRGDTALDAARVAGSGAGWVQVLDAGGHLLAASPQLTGQAPMTARRPAPGAEYSELLAWPVGNQDEHQLMVVARGVQTLGGPLVVLVGVPVDWVDQATDTALGLTLVGGPLLVLVTGFVTYAFAGRALRPVEAMRARVAALTDRDLSARVPTPVARDEVGRLADTMNEMLARLQSAQQAQRRFVADASHELRSPLATVVAGLELGQRSGTLEPADWEMLRAETDRLVLLVDDLVLLARADERGLAPRREDVDLDDLVEAEAARLRGLTGLTVEVDTTPTRVCGDHAQLARMVRNLVDNARRHARRRISLRAGHLDGGAVVEVSDDGPGVPPDQRERVFERFVRLEESRDRAAGGAGLGLAIVREVTGAHGGHVELTAAPGGGALFRVWLPTGTGISPTAPRR